MKKIAILMLITLLGTSFYGFGYNAIFYLEGGGGRKPIDVQDTDNFTTLKAKVLERYKIENCDINIDMLGLSGNVLNDEVYNEWFERISKGSRSAGRIVPLELNEPTAVGETMMVITTPSGDVFRISNDFPITISVE